MKTTQSQEGDGRGGGDKGDGKKKEEKAEEGQEEECRSRMGMRHRLIEAQWV